MYPETHWRARWKRFRRRHLLRVLPPLMGRAIRLLGSLVALRVLNPEKIDLVRRYEGPVLFAFWHGSMLLLPRFYEEHLAGWTEVCILISQHWDGEVIARTMERFGIRAIRGSSTRGGGTAFLGMLRTMRRGKSIAVALDGPRGPRYRAQPGVIRLGRLTGAPIFPVTLSAHPSWRIPSWDRFLVPLPGSSVRLHVGEPLTVPRTLDEAQEETYRIRLEEALRALTREADEAFEARRYIGVISCVYNALLLPVSLLLFPYMVRRMISTGAFKKALPERFGFIAPAKLASTSPQRPVWIHAVSVGEVMATVPLIKALRARYPTVPIVVSTITVTGRQTAERTIPEADAVIYFPFDYPWVAARSLKTIRPRLFVHTETEIWPNFLFSIQRMGIPSVIINGRISEDSCRRYSWFRFFFRRVLAPIEAFGMQSRTDCLRVIRMGADPRRVLVTGNMKFDHTVKSVDPEAQIALRASMGLPADAPVFVAGSTHGGEEDIVLSVYRRLRREFKDLKLLLAPRHPERFSEVERRAGETGFRVARRTHMLADKSGLGPSREQDIVILDTIGELAGMYAIGTLIFVGGSLVRVGGHNLLEPVAFKKPVLFGPHMENAVEIAQALKRRDGGIEVGDAESLYAEARRLLLDPALCQRMGRAAFGVIEEHHGATERNLSVLEPFLR